MNGWQSGGREESCAEKDGGVLQMQGRAYLLDHHAEEAHSVKTSNKREALRHVESLELQRRVSKC